MIAHVPLVCPYCRKKFNVSEAFIRGLLSTMKMNKVLEVARQMEEKRGPFYERWKVAMELRGAQKRCKTCLGFEPDDPVFFSNLCGYTGEKVNPGQFACKKYIRFDRN